MSKDHYAVLLRQMGAETPEYENVELPPLNESDRKFEWIGLQKEAFRQDMSRSPIFEAYYGGHDATAPLYKPSLPEWIVRHDDYKQVDQIIREQRLSQALNEQPNTRSNEQIQLLSMFLQDVWATAEELGSIGVREIAKTAGFSQVKRGDCVVREGEPGLAFYIIVSGSLDVVKRNQRVATLGSGSSFGEAALGVGAPPRNASLVCVSDEAELLVLHKVDYDAIMKDFQNAQHLRAFRCIKKVPLFAHWSRTRLNHLCGRLRWHHFKKGDVVIKQGDPCENIYFIIDGSCEVSKDIYVRNRNTWPTGIKSWVTKTYTDTITVALMDLGPDAYFGEKGILENSLRAATVTATKDSDVVSLDRLAFIDLLQRGHSIPNVPDNLGYATEAEIISIVNATTDHDDEHHFPSSNKKKVFAPLLKNRHLEAASTVGLLSTSLSQKKLLSHARAIDRSELGPFAAPDAAHEQQRASVVSGSNEGQDCPESSFDGSILANKRIPTWERKGHQVERAKLDLDARLRHHKRLLKHSNHHQKQDSTENEARSTPTLAARSSLHSLPQFFDSHATTVTSRPATSSTPNYPAIITQRSTRRLAGYANRTPPRHGDPPTPSDRRATAAAAARSSATQNSHFMDIIASSSLKPPAVLVGSSGEQL